MRKDDRDMGKQGLDTRNYVSGAPHKGNGNGNEKAPRREIIQKGKYCE